MLLLVFRSSLEDDIRQLLEQLQVHSYTAIPNVVGAGASGQAMGSLTAPSNMMIFLALQDDAAARVESGLQDYRHTLIERQKGAAIPLHIYSMPCQEII